MLLDFEITKWRAACVVFPTVEWKGCRPSRKQNVIRVLTGLKKCDFESCIIGGTHGTSKWSKSKKYLIVNDNIYISIPQNR